MALIMFDFDGVIVDSLVFFNRDFIAACHEYGFDEIKGYRDVMSLFDDNVFEAMIKKGLDQATVDSILSSYEKKAQARGNMYKLFDGMDLALRQISENNQIYVITSNVSEVVAGVLQANGINYVNEVIGGDVEKSKVKKIKMLMAKYPEAKAYYVGDTAGDIIEGRQAGALTVGVGWGWHGAEKLNNNSPDYLVKSPAQLADLLARIDDFMCNITFLPAGQPVVVQKRITAGVQEGITVAVPAGTTIMEAARQNNIPLEGPCNGNGTCGKCLVRVEGKLNQPDSAESSRLNSRGEGWRLACQARVLSDSRVTLSAQYLMQTVHGGKTRKFAFDPVYAADPGTSERVFGVAVDVGTTSIVASLNDLRNPGQELGTAASLNLQTKYGGDVLTRITFADKSPQNVIKLQKAVIDGINMLLADVCRQHSIGTDEVHHITIAANTTMLHLLAGINPISLAIAPYTPVFVDYQGLSAAQLGIKAAPEAEVSLLPSLTAFVGADILAGVMALDFHEVDLPSLFIDIGTNGEIVANVNGRLAATSSAAGPALEGMSIQCGRRAEEGAMSAARIDENGELIIETIGGAPCRGICGSGLVELVAELVKAGVIQSSGAFADRENIRGPLAERMVEFEGQKAFLIDARSQTVLTQKDIRQVQLAKGAIAAAITILFQRLAVDLKSVEKIYIAGAFGYHLKEEALKTIGLIPPGLDAEIEFVGNTAKEGARLALLSNYAMLELTRLQKTINQVELSYAPEFQENFVEQMDFPVQEA